MFNNDDKRNYKKERKSTKQKRIMVESFVLNGCKCLLFTMSETNLKFCIGTNNLSFFKSSSDISLDITAHFYNLTREYVYCMNDDIEREIEALNENSKTAN